MQTKAITQSRESIRRTSQTPESRLSESTRKQTKTEPRDHRFFAEVSPSRARSHVNLCVLEKPIPPLALGRGRWAPPPPPVRPSTHQPSDPHPESIPAVRRLCQPPRGIPLRFFPSPFRNHLLGSSSRPFPPLFSRSRRNRALPPPAEAKRSEQSGPAARSGRSLGSSIGAMLRGSSCCCCC
jgi:hypothetical protein